GIGSILRPGVTSSPGLVFLVFSHVFTGKRLERMISRFTFASIAAFFLLVAPTATTQAQPTPGSTAAAQAPKPLPFVSPLFADNMVLQRGKANTLWGWSEPGDKVKVEIGEATATGVAGSDHRWQVKIQPPPAGGPYTVKIGGRETVEL